MELREIAAVCGLPFGFFTMDFAARSHGAPETPLSEDLQFALERIRERVETLSRVVEPRATKSPIAYGGGALVLDSIDPELETVNPRLVEMADDRLKMRVFNELYERTSSAGDLAAYLGEDVGAVSSRLTALVDAGMVEVVEQPRPGEPLSARYTAVARQLFSDEQYACLAPAVRRNIVANVIDQISFEVQVALDAGGFDHARVHISRLPLRLDDQAFNELADVLRDALLTAATANADADERRVRERRQPEHETELVIMHFHRGPGPGG